jgi:hypothetical protein
LVTRERRLTGCAFASSTSVPETGDFLMVVFAVCSLGLGTLRFRKQA